MAVFNRQSMKHVRWIKGPMEKDRSRFAVLTEPIGSGSRNPGDRDDICNAKQGTARATDAANETGAHTPYVSFSIAGFPPCRARTHGYVRLFRYADDPPRLRERTRRRTRERQRRRLGRLSPSLFLLGTRQRESCALDKGVCRPSRLSRRRNPPRLHLPLKKPPTRRSFLAEGEGPLLATVKNLHVDALFDACSRIGWSLRSKLG